MQKGNHPSTKKVMLTTAEANALKERIKKGELTDKDVNHLLGLISFNLWLQERLSRAKLTIKRLRQIFGFKNESREKSKKKSPDKESSNDSKTELDAADNGDSDKSPHDAPSDTDSDNKAMAKVPEWYPEKNHGRYAASDYTGCPTIHISFEDEWLKEGKCPQCAECNTGAKVYVVQPMVLVLLDSQPLISGYQYHIEKGRCSVCNTIYKAQIPEDLANRPKYSSQCITSLAISHYYAGQPFNRIEALQAAQGVPLADSTQYDLMNNFYMSTVSHVMGALEACAANGYGLFFDDTPGNILEQITANKKTDDKKSKASVHATALLSEYEGHRIYLFNTNTLTAGKEFAKLLQIRESADPFITMTDASASNFPEVDDGLAAQWVISLCLSHARRKFVELTEDGDQDTEFVLDIIGQVYQNERYCKDHSLSDQERLLYHQQHSQPLMESLRIWFNNLILYQKIEPNSLMGQAIIYLLKRWHWLTQFLRIAGAPLDNNVCEQAIKVLIRYRKNSLFYRTYYGASIGDAMMSVIHTAVHAKVNIFDYLTRLQQYKYYVETSPSDWLPWNYQKTLAALTQVESGVANVG